jgi:hypothetical protein
MAYSDFDLKKVVTDFQLELIEEQDMFSQVPERDVSELFMNIIKQHLPLALAMNTEKARSELVLINIFMELRLALGISFFSGAKFDVDKEQGLTGFCDFLVSQTAEQLYIKAPVVAVVEAKNENISGGLGQCLAEMVALQLYNTKEQVPISTVYGAVTTADTWKFLKLQEKTAYIDMEYYYLNTPQKILGILAAMVKGQA